MLIAECKGLDARCAEAPFDLPAVASSEMYPPSTTRQNGNVGVSAFHLSHATLTSLVRSLLRFMGAGFDSFVGMEIWRLSERFYET